MSLLLIFAMLLHARKAPLKGSFPKRISNFLPFKFSWTHAHRVKNVRINDIQFRFSLASTKKPKIFGGAIMQKLVYLFVKQYQILLFMLGPADLFIYSDFRKPWIKGCFNLFYVEKIIAEEQAKSLGSWMRNSWLFN